MTYPTYPTALLTDICNQLLDERLSHDEIASLAADIPGECEAICEAAYERQQERLMESGGPDDSGYRRDMVLAGRGYLLK
jgi:hypothetical protein